MPSSSIYRLADLHIASELALPELGPPVADGAGDAWRVRESSEPYPGPEADWFHRWMEPDGRHWLQIGRKRGSYVLRFARWASFVVAPHSRLITCHRASGTPDHTLRHLLLNQVLPLVNDAPDRIVLHAGAVKHRSGAIAFVGDSGSGKSTLCASLSGQHCALLTDDALVLLRRGERFHVMPTYPGVRLWPDAVPTVTGRETAGEWPAVAHYTGKIRLDTLPFARERVVLERICVLTPEANGTTLSVERMRARDAVLALTRCQFQLDIGDRAQLAAAFEVVTHLVQQVPVVRVSCPWRLDGLRDSAARLLEILAERQ